MSRTIKNIASILDSYGNGKLFDSRRGKVCKKVGARDSVSISDEARERFRSGGNDREVADAGRCNQMECQDREKRI